MTAALHPSCDRSAASSEPATAKAPSRPRLVLATTILASSLAFIDGSVVNVGLPTLGGAMHASPAQLQWVVNAYLLPLSALLLLGGAAGDRYGRKQLLIGGIALFALASLLCALAPSLPLLLAGRAAQGIGAAMLMPNSLAILGASFSGEAKGSAIGSWAATGAIAGAIGPVLGGALIDGVGWRAIFAINLPLAIAAIALALLAIEEEPDDGHRPPLDWAGAVLATAGLGALTYGLTTGSGPEGWNRTAALAMGGGIVLLLGFLLVERRRGDRAMMPLSLFGSAPFVGLTLLTLLLYGALGGLLVLLPYVLIEAAHYSGTAAGAALLPLPLVISVASPLMGGFAGRVGSRLPLSIGPLVVALGLVLLLRVGPEGHYWTEVLPAIVVIALGMAGAVAPLTTAVLSSVDGRHTGSASGLNSAVARTGGLVATALLGAVLASQGDALVAGFHRAAVAGAVSAALAGVSAFVLLGRSP